MKKFAIIFGAIAIVGLSGFLFIQKVSADESLEDYPPMIQRISEAFGLNPEEVEAKMNQYREEHHEEKMSVLIADGDLTQDQVDLIKEHHEEMRAALEAIREDGSLSWEERREAMRDIHIEYREGAQELGLPCGDFEGMKGGGFGGREGHGMGMGGGFRFMSEE